MAGSFSGNTSTDAIYTTPVAGYIKPFTIVNKTTGAITVNCYKITNGYQICIMPLNKSLAAGEMYSSEQTKAILAEASIKVQTSGSVDYDFNVSSKE